MYQFIEERARQKKEHDVEDEQRRLRNEKIAAQFQLDLLGTHGRSARGGSSIFLRNNQRLAKQRLSFNSGLYADEEDEKDQDDGSPCLGGLSLRESMQTKRTEVQESEHMLEDSGTRPQEADELAFD